MRLNKFVLVLILLLGFDAANAKPRTFDFIFDGKSLPNTARAVGTITFEDTLLANVFDPNAQFTNYVYYIGGPEVLTLSVTVSGASAGNGVFGAQDFDRVEWQPNGTLDLDRQLIGQPTVNEPWGTPLAGLGGDFNLFGISAFAPRGVAPFELASAGGESMQLVSMAAVAAPVPEPASWAALLCGLSLVAAGVSRRRRYNGFRRIQRTSLSMNTGFPTT